MNKEEEKQKQLLIFQGLQFLRMISATQDEIAGSRTIHFMRRVNEALPPTNPYRFELDPTKHPFLTASRAIRTFRHAQYALGNGHQVKPVPQAQAEPAPEAPAVKITPVAAEMQKKRYEFHKAAHEGLEEEITCMAKGLITDDNAAHFEIGKTPKGVAPNVGNIRESILEFMGPDIKYAATPGMPQPSYHQHILTISFQSFYDTRRVKIVCTEYDLHWPINEETQQRLPPNKSIVEYEYLRGGSIMGGSPVDAENRLKPFASESRDKVLSGAEKFLTRFIEAQFKAMKMFGESEPSPPAVLTASGGVAMPQV